MECKISVVVPVYKVRDRIKRTLESLKHQKFKNFEVLFVDDGSPDDSSDFADEYLKDSDVVYRIIKKENGGVSSARNLGIEKAQGEYIMFLDSDDYIEDDMLNDFYKKALQEDYDVLYSAYVFEESDGRAITNNINDLKSGSFSGKEAALGLIYGVSYTHIMANLFKRSLLLDNDIRFDENRKFAEDISFMVKAYADSKKVCCIDKIYAHYVKWGESAMNNINLNYLDVYYSNVETLQYIRDKFNDKDMERAMTTSRIPAAIVNIFIGFASNKDLHNDMYKFIDDKNVRRDLKRYKMYKIEKDRLKYLILSKFILYKPAIIEKYYQKRDN